MKRKVLKVIKELLQLSITALWVSMCIGCGVAYGFFQTASVILKLK